MSELPTDTLSGAELLMLAVESLQSEQPGELPEQVALARTRTLIECSERLNAVRLAAVRDVDRRELYALDGAGSARGWLRTQLGGEKGQLTMARRLEQHPLVDAALAAGQVSSRASEQLCAVLDKVPDELDEGQLVGVIGNGIADLLTTYTGGIVPDSAATEQLLAARAEVAEVLAGCCADTTSTPAKRLEPALVLLARRLSPGHLGPALRWLLEALLPDGSDGDDRDHYYFELRELLDGDVDVRGHLTPEVGRGLAEEIERRVRAAKRAAKAQQAAEQADAPASSDAASGPDASAESTTLDATAGGPEPESDVFAEWDDEPRFFGGDRAPGAQGRIGARRVGVGRRRHDALAQLLDDLASVQVGSGQPLPNRLTITGTIEALEGRLGALPGTLETGGQPVPLTTAQLRRMGCYSDINAVLLDALGNPIGASHTRRNLTPRERRALRAQWGPHCAVAGCTSTRTVPHHVEPYWWTRLTRYRDMIPICEHCHHDVHDGHRTLRLRDGRLINELGWVAVQAYATAA